MAGTEEQVALAFLVIAHPLSEATGNSELRRAFLILAVSAALLGWKGAPEMVQPGEAVRGGEAWRAAGAIGISGPQQNSSAD